MSHQITMFTQPGCGQCIATSRLFSKLGVEPVIVDVTQKPEALELVRSWGYASAPIIAVTPISENVISESPVVTVSDIKGSVLDHWSGFRESKIREAATFVLAHRDETPRPTAMPVRELSAALAEKYNITPVAAIELIGKAVGHDLVVASSDGFSPDVTATNVERTFEHAANIYESGRAPLSHRIFILGVQTSVSDLSKAHDVNPDELSSDELTAARLERDHAVRDAVRVGVSYTKLVELTDIAQPTLEKIVAGFPGPDRGTPRSESYAVAESVPTPSPSLSVL